MSSRKGDKNKTREELLQELEELRQHCAAMEASNEVLKFFEITLHESEKKYRSLFENMQSGFALHKILLDDKGKPIDYIFLEVNKEFEVQTGLKREAIIGKRVTEVLPGIEHDPARWIDTYGEVALTGKGVSFEKFSVPLQKWFSVIAYSSQKDYFATVFVDVTQEKQAEVSLRESEEKYRSVVNNANEAIFVIQDWMVKFSNPKALEVSGFSEEELKGRPFVEFIHPDDRDMVAERHQKRLRGEAVESVYSFRIITKSKETRWVEIKPVQIVWEDRPATLNFLSDITERKHAEMRLKKSEENLAKAQEIAHVGSWEWDFQSEEIHCSDELHRIFGIEKDVKLSLELMQNFIHPEDKAVINRAKEDLLAGRPPKFLDYRIVRANGEVRCIHLKGEVFYDGSQRITKMIGTAQDITERIRIDEELGTQQERYKLSTTAGRVGVWDWDIKNDKFYLDPIIKEFLGYKDEEIPNDLEVWVNYVHPDDRQPVMDAAQACLDGKTAEYVYEHRMIHKDGSIRWIDVRGNVLRDDKGSAIRLIGTDTDITERKRMEEEKKRLEEQLRHAQKMEAIGTLAGGIAHEFNNMLGTIVGFTELAIEDLPEGDRIRHNLEKVTAAADRATEMVKQILSFSRKEEEKRKPLYLSRILNESLALLKLSLPSTIEMRTNIAESSKPVMANPTQIHQVIMNLCTNAAHAMRDTGGMMEIALKEVEIDADSTEQGELEPGIYQQLTVRDTGHGMDAEIKRRIFEPYFTTKKVGEGTGMGLAVVHGIIKAHRGEITAESEPGKGAVFHILLPTALDKHVPEKAQPEPIQGGTERILFVDDEAELSEMGKQMLEKLGYVVTIKTNSPDALETFRAKPDQFDLVITDQTMPHMTGIRLTGKIRNIRADIPVILCTGFSEQIGEENYRDHGIDAFVMKPITRQEIARVIRKVLDKK